MTVKTYPTKSAGPHYAPLPLRHPLLRLIPGDPRKACPPLEWLITPLTITHLRATVDNESAIIPLTADQAIPAQYFDFQYPPSYVTITLLAPTPIAYAIFLPSDFEAQEGVICRPLIDVEGIPIAKLTLDFILITPGPQNFPKKTGKYVPRFTGHRGMGSSGVQASWRPLENAPVSFIKAAGGNGAVKSVELDVQLSKDGKTVIYHDWCYRPSGERDNSKRKSVLKIPLYNMKFEEFDSAYRNLYADMKVQDKGMEERFGSEAMEVRLRTLKDICRQMPEDVGMLVEVKFPPPNVQEDEMLTFPAKNELCNAVLRDLYEANGKRKVSLLSFEADICMMLRMKQDVYPVYFLHCETMDPPCDMTDPRTIDLDEGIKFATGVGMEGMVLFNELALKKKECVAKAVESGLTVLTYGGSNREAECVREQFDMGINGVIADDVLELVEALGE